MNSTKKKAKIAGLIYLFLVITGVFSLLYVPSVVIVSGNATATAESIMSSELLFRLGIFVGLISSVIFLFLVFALHRLLKEINRSYALLMVTLVVVSVSTGFVHSLSQMAVLILLSGADFLSVFEKAELDALAYLFLRFHSYGLQALQIFWGLWLFPFGLLVYKSRFIPKILGVLLIAAGFGYFLSSFTFLVLPQFSVAISPLFTVLEIGELPIVIWLLVVGAKDQAAEKLTPPGR